jgi:hypothetical protein
MGYLEDVMTAMFYDRQVPYEDDPVKEAQYGSVLRKSEPELDPWELLAAAVVSHAAKDYVQAVARGNEKGAEESRQFFRKNGFLEDVLAGIDSILQKAGTRREIERIEQRMRLFW